MVIACIIAYLFGCLAYVLLGIQVVLTYVEFYLMCALFTVFVPFGVTKWTSFLAEKAIGGVIAYGESAKAELQGLLRLLVLQAKVQQAQRRTLCMEQALQGEVAHHMAILVEAAAAEVLVHRSAVEVHPAMAVAAHLDRLHPICQAVLPAAHREAVKEAAEVRPRVADQAARLALTKGKVLEAVFLVPLQELREALPEARLERLSAELQQARPGLLQVA